MLASEKSAHTGSVSVAVFVQREAHCQLQIQAEKQGNPEPH